MDGAMKVYPLGEISAFERQLLEEALPELKRNVEKGIEFINKFQAK